MNAIEYFDHLQKRSLSFKRVNELCKRKILVELGFSDIEKNKIYGLQRKA